MSVLLSQSSNYNNNINTKTASLPLLDHLLLSDYEYIYEPSDDTFLLCDALEFDRNLIISNNPSTILEIGSGSGCVITFITKLLIDEGIVVQSLATDINPYAVSATISTGKANKVFIDAVLCNFVNGFNLDLIQYNIDLLLFNPPYVPTPSEEICGNGVEVSWAGGIDGREVIDKFLPLIHVLLSPIGICYIVLVEENKPKEIISMLTNYGLFSKIVKNRKAYNENLMILKIAKFKISE